MNRLDYNYIKPGQPQQDPTKFRIQASGIADFFDSTTYWYRNKLLGEDGFLGSTTSVAGTVLHFLAEQYSINGQITDLDRADIDEYISLQASDTIDPDEVKPKVKPMWAALKQYLIEHPVSLSEPFIESPTLNNSISVGGSIDGIVDLTDPTAKYQSLNELPLDHRYKLIDYKSTSSKLAPKSMSRKYEWQLLVYAYCLKKEVGIDVVEIEDIFINHEHIGEISPKTGKQLKSYPSVVTPIGRTIGQEDFDFIESIINLISDSVYKFITTPEDRYLLAMDYRLKGNTQQLPFKVESKQIDI